VARILGIAVILSTLSIITVTYQSAEKLPDFLASARSAASEAEHIVVDNASTDRTTRVAHRHGAHQVVESPTNVGFGRACNLGADCASGDWLLFANPDLTIESVPTLEPTCSRPFGIAGGWLSERGNPHKPSLRAEPTLPEEAIAQLLYRLVPNGISRFARQRRRPACWASGALLLCRRSEFLELGGFDPRFFLYFEDRDLAGRYRRRDFPLHLDARLRGHHGHGKSSPSVRSWVREAWSLISWIEYRGIWHGPPAARHAAGLTLSTLSSMHSLGERIPGDRAKKKAAEAAHIIAFLCDFEQHLTDATGFYPFAGPALHDLFSDRRL
jgi:N-acetylglucosaminyl-diphospho-decaprenol L-rhamnosyltransferase